MMMLYECPFCKKKYKANKDAKYCPYCNQLKNVQTEIDNVQKQVEGLQNEFNGLTRDILNNSMQVLISTQNTLAYNITITNILASKILYEVS